MAGRASYNFSRKLLTNVFLQLGTQHVPRMAWSNEGVVKVFGQKVYVVGGAAAGFGYCYVEGKISPNTLLGGMLSGGFKVALVGGTGLGARQIEFRANIEF